jgi:DeoR/GlpR family transcriptional regulator of sugar metabolism
VFDNSSSAFEMAKLLKDFRGLTVFATSQATLNDLSKNTNIDVYCSGGLYSPKTDAFIGSAAEDFLDRVQASACFVGAMGLTVRDGLTDPLPAEASLKRKIIERSKTVVVLADSSKIGGVVMEKVEEVKNLDYLVTDWEADKNVLEDLKEHMNVIVCEQD